MPEKRLVLLQTKLTEPGEQDIAEKLAEKQRDISISEFFTKNRHLLGFDNPRKALLTAVKEAVDNSLDACEEMKVLPEIKVEIKKDEEKRYSLIVEDNGPGIVKEQIPKIFGKLLYGSKFHKLAQSLTGDEPILIRQDGKINVVAIGDLIDNHVKKEGEALCTNIEVPCFDWTNYKYSFRKVSHLIKHKRRNEIYDVHTTYGKHIKITGCHSVFTVNKDTLKAEEVEARNLREGDIILAPKKMDIDSDINEVNILDYIEEDYARKQGWYLYTDKKIILSMFENAEIIHKKKQGGKSRKYYRLTNNGKTADILDESYKQYVSNGFVPLWIAKFIRAEISEGCIRTYYHGKEHNIPLVWGLNSGLMKMFGLFVAEGHTDNRQIGFTFSRDERDLVRLVSDVGYSLGANYTIEERPDKNCVRVKLFGGILSHLFRQWFGRGAKNKRLPDFIFGASKGLRQDFINYLYAGDGHNTKGRNQLMLTTTSKELANQVIYLWLMQGIVAASTSKLNQVLGKSPSLAYVVTVYGGDINKSNYYSTNTAVKRRAHDFDLRLISKKLGSATTKETLCYLDKLKSLDSDKEYDPSAFQNLFNAEKIGYKIRFMLDNNYISQNTNGTYCVAQKTAALLQEIENLKVILASDFMFLEVKDIETITKGYEYVYDISVPGNENFVGGFGAIACHNSRGQQGIGISATALYSQLTTGKGIKIISKTGKNKPAHFYELHLNLKSNDAEIVAEEQKEWDVDHGTKLQVTMEAEYLKGKQSVDDYLKSSAMANPHATFHYKSPQDEWITYARATNDLPKEPKIMKPHPYGVELGVLMRLLKDTDAATLQSFLMNEFSRVSPKVAKEICENANLYERARPSRIARQEVDNLFKAIQLVKIMAPPTDCLSPIGKDLLIKGLKKEVDAEFYAATTRPPAVYRGNPFQAECCTGDSKLQLEDGSIITIKEYVENQMLDKKVYSMDDKFLISPSKVLMVHKFKNQHKILKVTTKSGRTLKLTQNNEIPIIEDGEIVWKKVEDAMTGEFVAVPRHLKVYGKIPSILDILNPHQVKVIDSILVIEVMEHLKNKYGSYKSSALKLGIKYDDFKAYKRHKYATRPNLNTFLRMISDIGRDDLKYKISHITIVDNKFTNPNVIKVPEINEDMLYILGLLNSDGYISRKGIYFINLDESLHNSYREKTSNLFGLDVKKYRKDTSSLCNKTLYLVLKQIEHILPSLPDNLIISWLKGFVDGDGWVTISGDKLKGIGIATAKIEKAELVQTLLLRLGILSKIEKQNISNAIAMIGERRIITKYPKYNIIITDLDNMRKFHSIISFRQAYRANAITDGIKQMAEIESHANHDVIPLGMLLRNIREENDLYQYELGFSEQTIRSVEKNNQLMSRIHVQQMLSMKDLTGVMVKKLRLLAFSDLLWDKIVNIELMPNEEYVYDLTVETGNFVANNIVMHNCAIAFGGTLPGDELIKVYRFANRVPLQYKQSDCAMTKSIISTMWRNYGLSQSKGALPVGPVVIMMHIASAWVPFTSESKEAVASYPEIVKEIKLALQECGRDLASYVRKIRKAEHEKKRQKIFDLYIEEVAESLHKLTGHNKAELKTDMHKIASNRTGTEEQEEFPEDKPKHKHKSGETDDGSE